MKMNMCSDFNGWLDRLPQEPLSDEWSQHLKSCTDCRERYEQIGPIVEALLDIPAETELDEHKINKMALAAAQEAARLFKRRSAVKLTLNIILGLPFVLVINWVWFTLGSRILTETVSHTAAAVFTVVFLIGSSLILALILGTTPLLWGYYLRFSSKECWND
ncbi:hypothetical protein ACFLT9_02995 [Acidobacteriota bacterium]